MAPREIPLDEHGDPLPASRPVKLIAIVFFALILALAFYSILAGGLSAGEGAAADEPPPMVTADATTGLPALLIVTATPPATATAAPAATPTPAATVAASPACPPAEPVPDGARVGWLARAAGCPSVLYARVNGEGRWVLKPADFPDDLYSQLPEL